jgi:hypothetical protein
VLAPQIMQVYVYLIESVSFRVRAASDDRLNTPSVVIQPRSSKTCGSAVCLQHSTSMRASKVLSISAVLASIAVLQQLTSNFC